MSNQELFDFHINLGRDILVRIGIKVRYTFLYSYVAIAFFLEEIYLIYQDIPSLALSLWGAIIVLLIAFLRIDKSIRKPTKKLNQSNYYHTVERLVSYGTIRILTS